MISLSYVNTFSLVLECGPFVTPLLLLRNLDGKMEVLLACTIRLRGQSIHHKTKNTLRFKTLFNSKQMGLGTFTTSHFCLVIFLHFGATSWNSSQLFGACSYLLLVSILQLRIDDTATDTALAMSSTGRDELEPAMTNRIAQSKVSYQVHLRMHSYYWTIACWSLC